MSVQDVLDAQVAAWNAGDIDGFCSWYTEDCVYVGASGVRRGRNAARDGYVARYPDRAAMGTLSLDVVSVEDRDHTAIAVVKWSLRAASDHGGHALLVFRRSPEGWRLAYDATV